MFDIKRLTYLGLGVVFGILLLWLLLREISVVAVRQTLAVIDFRYLSAAITAYAVAILIRTLRWRDLLARSGPVRYTKVLLVLIIGYAVNNLLPARLGEIARADLARSKLGLSRFEALGTIAIERMMDGITVVGMLAIGLIALPRDAQYAITMRYVLAASGALFGTLTIVFVLLSKTQWAESAGISARIRRPIAKFRDGLQVLRSRNMILIALLTVPVWVADCASVWFVLCSVHVTLSPLQLMLTIGIVSLSMLLPTAPGYLGTYQLAFVMAVTSFGFSKAQGFAAALTSQTFILGPHCVIGIALMIINHVRVASLLNPDLAHAPRPHRRG